MNNTITNPIAGAAWLAFGGVIGLWFRGRLEAAKNGDISKLRNTAEAFGALAIWLLTFLVLAWLF